MISADGERDVLCNVAKVGNLGLDTPVPLVLEEKGVVEEESKPVSRGMTREKLGRRHTQSRNGT